MPAHTELRAALEQQAAATPEWRPWLDMLGTAVAVADEPAWRCVEIRFAAARPEHAPLLEGARVLLDAPATTQLLDALLARAEVRPDVRRALDAPLVLEAALSLAASRLRDIARPARVPEGVLATAAEFAAMPVLQEAARRAASAVPPDWRPGYCPVCGAWPTLAELRGLERRCMLRCGRCAAEWPREVLLCTFCHERDHRRQRALVPAEGGEFVRIETCDSCRGYLKVVTTLRAKPAWALPLDDLRTLPLELKAIERGYARPDTPGWQPTVRVGELAITAP